MTEPTESQIREHERDLCAIELWVIAAKLCESDAKVLTDAAGLIARRQVCP